MAKSDFYGDHWSTKCATCGRGFPHPRLNDGEFAVCPECVQENNNDNVMDEIYKMKLHE